MQDHRVESHVAIIGTVSIGQSGDLDVGPIQSPDTLSEPQCMKPSHHDQQGVMDKDDGVLQHVLQGAAHLQDRLPDGSIVPAKQVAHISEAGRHGQVQQCQG